MEDNMITLIGALLGFVSSAFPDVLKLWKDSKTQKHELEMLKIQMEQQRQGHLQKIEMVQANADIAESKALYRTYHSGIGWVDALNGTVRPVLAYSFFFLYASMKWAQISALPDTISIANSLPLIWTIEDQAIFAGIISFYFGQRAMHKIRCQ